MVRNFSAAMLCAGALAAASAEDAEIKYRPLSIAGMAEFGQLYGARYSANAPLDQDWLDHFGVFITQTADVGERLSFDIGLGGIFQYMKREVVQAQWLGTQWKSFGVGPTVADIRYGSLSSGEGFGVQFGRFAYKYNPDATNLGEYLFRSGAYPTFVLGGGYAMIGTPEAHLQGLRLNYRNGGLTTDLLVITENTMPALYDFSVAGLVGYKVADGLLDIGAGVNMKRILPVRPSKTSREIANNSYFTRDGITYVGDPNYYQGQADFFGRRRAETRAQIDAAAAAGGDTSALVALETKFRADSLAFQTTANNVGFDGTGRDAEGNPRPVGWRDSVTQLHAGASYYTQQAVMLMGRVSVDFKKLMESDLFGPNDMRFSVEANILGVKKYPVFYGDFTERMPVTATFNLPAFRVLDLLSVQAEYFNSPWLNSYESVVRQNAAIPTLVNGRDEDWNRSAWNDISERDNWSWSVLARKRLTAGLWASAQFARDHSRTVSQDVWAGPGLFPTEVLSTEKDWYWMVQLGFGI